jgi:uncharacterized protein YdhG (YjbR/CyaY superfamily)
MQNKPPAYSNIDEYIATFPADIRQRLEVIRAAIRAAAPQAREKISYQIPAYELNGNLIYFAGYKNHTSIYPIPRGTQAFQQKIQPYIFGRGTLRFANSQPLPLQLIHEVIQTRLAEHLEKRG